MDDMLGVVGWSKLLYVTGKSYLVYRLLGNEPGWCDGIMFDNEPDWMEPFPRLVFIKEEPPFHWLSDGSN